MNWISVEDQLPKEWVEVLIASNRGNVSVGVMSTSDEIKDAHVWFESKLDGNFGKVTHWMPFPDPPKKYR